MDVSAFRFMIFFQAYFLLTYMSKHVCMNLSSGNIKLPEYPLEKLCGRRICS